MRKGILWTTLFLAACGDGDPVSGGDTTFDGGPGGSGGQAGSSGGSAGSEPSGGSGGSGGGVSNPFIGGPCASDADCGGEPLFCLTTDSDEFGGGPPGGMCVADCTVGGGDACVAIDDFSVCLQVGGVDTLQDTSDDVSYCVPACQVGFPDQSKCGGRTDVSCRVTTQPPLGYCFPSCGDDGQCDGRVCDLSLGVCTDGPVGTKPIGAACTDSNECEGLCLLLAPDYGICSGLCNLGAAGCGETPGTDPSEVACLFSEVPGLSGPGDAGFCAELCDCNDDCERSDAICEDAGTEALTGRTGVCFPPDVDANGNPLPGIPCGGTTDGGAGADAAVSDAAVSIDASGATDASSTPEAGSPPDGAVEAGGSLDGG